MLYLELIGSSNKPQIISKFQFILHEGQILRLEKGFCGLSGPQQGECYHGGQSKPGKVRRKWRWGKESEVHYFHKDGRPFLSGGTVEKVQGESAGSWEP